MTTAVSLQQNDKVRHQGMIYRVIRKNPDGTVNLRSEVGFSLKQNISVKELEALNGDNLYADVAPPETHKSSAPTKPPVPKLVIPPPPKPFDYADLTVEARVVVQQKTGEIRERLDAMKRSAIEIGQRLIEVKSQLQHGQWGAWLTLEFQWSQDTAERLINTAKLERQNPQFAEYEDRFQKTALMALAAPSTPQAARQEAIERATAGETITHTAAQTIIQAHRHIDTETGEILDTVPDTSEDATPSTETDILQDKKPSLPQHRSESNEWYTPTEYVEAVRAVMQTIDLDPASCEVANETVRAATWFEKADDGLKQAWYGRVFLNPPYGWDEEYESNAGKWSARLIQAWQSREIEEAVLLVNASTGADWFQALWQFPICFVRGRISFIPSGEKKNSPTHYNCFVYFGDDETRFAEIFEQFGEIR